MLNASGQHHISRTINHLLRYIVSKWRAYVYRHKPGDTAYMDDFVRSYLKKISSYAYEKTFTCGPAYMLITHLHALTGQAPFEKQQILDDIEVWISEYKDPQKKTEKKQIDIEHLKTTLESLMTKNGPDGTPKLSFLEFCNDFMRWGTNGGAPKTTIFRDTYRTKWAWALFHSTNHDGTLKRDYNLYQRSLDEKQTAQVALKQEAQKTREIITTPMSSYLRQSYLMYRWGTLGLPSPISSSNWLAQFEARRPSWYGCVDGERFDQSIPADAILLIISMLGRLDSETYTAAADEIEHLKTLKIRWAEKTWQWRGGLLSGWRLTSFIGSLISYAASTYMIANSHAPGAFEIGVMGDDVVLTSYSASMTAEQLVSLYRQFGLSANLAKTVAGPVGEFLRKVRSSRGSLGFPALGLRSLVYANPWVSNYKFEYELETSQAWSTVTSRLLQHATDPENLIKYINTLTIHDLQSRFGNQKWRELLLTPVSAGGLGYIEHTDITKWHLLDKRKSVSALPIKYRIPAMLGVLKPKMVITSIRAVPLSVSDMISVQGDFLSNFAKIRFPTFKPSQNKTFAIYTLMFNRPSISTINSWLAYPIPRSYRTVSNTAILDLLLTPPDKFNGITSISHSLESTTRLNASLNFTMEKLSQKKNNSIRTIGAASTIFATLHYRNISLPSGTW